MISGLDHVQVAMPPGGEQDARDFYGRVLAMREVGKPEPLRARGGCWFEAPGVQVHVGTEPGFTPSAKAHLALLVEDLEGLGARLTDAGAPFERDGAVPGVRRAYTRDPFGNRIELIAEGDGFTQQDRWRA